MPSMSRGVDAVIQHKVCIKLISKAPKDILLADVPAAFFDSPPGNSILARLVIGTSFLASPANNTRHDVHVLQHGGIGEAYCCVYLYSHHRTPL
jgi:hypothetical protein